MQSLLLATNSENAFIAGATAVLINKGWPTDLIIYEDFYLQNMVYKDAIPGIEWHLVVLLPANLLVQYLGSGSKLYYVSIAIASLAIFLAALGLAAVLYNRNTRLLRLTRPTFTFIVLGGAIILGIYCIMLLGHNNTVSCTIRPWMFNLSFTLAFSPLLIKAYMVHKLFNHKPLTKNKNISTHKLIIYTLSLVAIDVILLLGTIYGAGSSSSKLMTVQKTYGAVTVCATTVNKSFLYVELAFKGLLVGTGCVLSFLVRKISGTLAGSKALMLIIYNIAVVCLVSLLIINNVTNMELSIFCQVIGICICIIFTTGVLVVPTLYKLITLGDNAATEEVMNEIFVAKTKYTSHATNNSRREQENSHDSSSSAVFGFRKWFPTKDKKQTVGGKPISSCRPKPSTINPDGKIYKISSGKDECNSVDETPNAYRDNAQEEVVPVSDKVSISGSGKVQPSNASGSNKVGEAIAIIDFILIYFSCCFSYRFGARDLIWNLLVLTWKQKRHEIEQIDVSS